MLVATVAVLAIGVLAHHVVTSRARRRFGERLAAVTAFLAPHVVARAGLYDAVLEAQRAHGDPAVATVLRRWRSGLEGQSGADISRVLVEIGEVARLTRAARTARNDRRLEAIRGLVECGGADAGGTLARAADTDPVPEIRRAARVGLLGVRSRDAVEAAVRSYLRDVRSGRGWRRSFFARMADQAPDQLGGLIDSGRLSAADEKLGLEALGDAPHAAAIGPARARLVEHDPELRAAAARTLGKLGDRDSFAALVSLLNDPVWYVRAAAARALGTLPVDGRASIALGRALGDSTWWVRAKAAQSLSLHGASGVDALIGAVGGGDRYARDIALGTLAVLELPADARRELSRVAGTSATGGQPPAVA